MKRTMFGILVATGVAATLAVAADIQQPAAPLGLPPVPIPADNPQTPEKIALGKKLFECRAGLSLRFIFLDRPNEFYVSFLGNHDEVKQLLKSGKY